MPVRHFLRRDYLHILFYIKFLLFCSLAPDGIRILCGKIRGFPRSEYLSTIVFLQFSKKFYYSGCLTSSLNPVKKQRDCPEVYNFYSNGKLQKNTSILQTLISRESITFWKIPILTNCRFRIARKKKKIIHPRCGLGACLRCGRAS